MLGARTVPVIDHLQGQDQIQGETSKEAVQDQLIVHFLQSGEDPCQRPSEIVEDLRSKIISIPPFYLSPLVFVLSCKKSPA